MPPRSRSLPNCPRRRVTIVTALASLATRPVRRNERDLDDVTKEPRESGGVDRGGRRLLRPGALRQGLPTAGWVDATRVSASIPIVARGATFL
jgi:hypothetical protein